MIDERRGIIVQQTDPAEVYELKPGMGRCKHILESGHQCQLARDHVRGHAWEPAWVVRVAQIEAAEREAPLVKPQPKSVKAGCIDI